MHYRLIAMSRFGYLRTPLPADASAAAQANAHAALLDALGIERTIIVGASAGAPSAMQFALLFPERTAALILLVPATYVPRPEGAPSLNVSRLVGILSRTALHSDFVLWFAIRHMRDLLTRSILGTPPEIVRTSSADERRRILDALALVLPVSSRRRGLMNDASICSTLPRYDLERIAVPTLAISCADDLYGTFDCARYTIAHIPGARFVSYPTGGHLWVGHQRDVANEMLDFLAGLHAPPVRTSDAALAGRRN
jgi:pimeloyl-ACP methyl ester carboxylesterase